MNLNSEQKEALEKLVRFVTTDTYNTFILKGFAETGKTILISELLQCPEVSNTPIRLLASTGRAAKNTIAKDQPTGPNCSQLHICSGL